jgi:hypothetical protein
LVALKEMKLESRMAEQLEVLLLDYWVAKKECKLETTKECLMADLMGSQKVK